MVFKIGQLLEKGEFNWKGLKNILHDHEARLDALEGATDSDTIYDDSSITQRVGAVETAIGDAETEGTILARLYALENPSEEQTPSQGGQEEQTPSQGEQTGEGG